MCVIDLFVNRFSFLVTSIDCRFVTSPEYLEQNMPFLDLSSLKVICNCSLVSFQAVSKFVLKSVPLIERFKHRLSRSN